MTLGQLGERLRARRKMLGKSMKEIADATGLSVGFISQIERNLTVPSLVSLATVADVLGVSIGELTGQVAKASPDTHQADRETYSLPNGQVRYERLSSSFEGRVLRSVKFTMPVGYRSETVSHAGEEFVYVLSGTILYRVEQKEYPLGVGDSLHFDATKQHSIEALSGPEGFTEVLWAGTLEIFGDSELTATKESDVRFVLDETEFRELSELP
ncbi:transcriptional regulator (plasmid) [Burkholderia sp. SFA1]|nr:transcriptional regulator [Burkholderia sp. SFA1]